MSACDKASGKSQKITITSDKGRLSEEEIARMVKEAEDNAEADKAQRARVDAKNSLEGYLYSLKSSMQDTLKDKVSQEDRDKVIKLVTETLSWLEENPNEEKDTYDDKRKEVEDVANPIIAKAYSAPPPSGGGGEGEGGSPPPQGGGGADGSGGSEGPTVEEV